MAKAAISAEGVFIEDLLLVDYLNAVLTTEPPKNMGCSPEFLAPQLEGICKPATGGRRLKLVDTTKKVPIDSEQKTTESLRAENELLKNKIVRAETHTELIKSENSKLAAEISRLKTKQYETTADAEQLKAENDSLLSEIAFLKTQQQKSLVAIEALAAENNAIKAQLAPLQQQINELAELQRAQATADRAAAQDGDTQVDQVVHEELHEAVCAVAETVQPVIHDQLEKAEHAVTTTSPQKPKLSEIAQVSVEERMIFTGSSQQSAQHGVALKVDAKPAVFSTTRTAPASTVKTSKTVSRVIKQQTLSVKQELQEQHCVFENEKKQPVSLPRFIEPALFRMHEPAQHDEQQLELKTARQELKKALDEDAIKLGAAPASKVVLKRNAQNYEVLQQEADTENPAPEFNLTLIT